MLSLAEQLIFERYKRPEFSGVLDPADFVVDGLNQSCGDEVKFFVRRAGETILEMRHQTRACAICTASADLLCERIIGKQIGEISEEEVVSWLEIPLSPTRRKCATLSLQTLRRGLDSAPNQA